jgi:hypothetical protein
MNRAQKFRDLEKLASVNAALRYVGGAVVERPFRFGQRDVKRGEKLTSAELATIPPANLKALAANRFLAITLDPAAYRRDQNHRSSDDNAV